VPRSFRELHVQIGTMTAQLTQCLGRTPTAGELADALGVDREKVIEVKIASEAYHGQSLDAPVRGGRHPDDRQTMIGMLG